MNKINVLLITEYWRAGKEEYGISNSQHNYFGSLQSVPWINVDMMCYDANMVYVEDQHGEKKVLPTSTPINDKHLLVRCMHEEIPSPDVIVYTETSHSDANPDYITLAAIRRTLGIPIVMLWTDSDGDDIAKLEAKYPFVDLHAIMDHFDYHRHTQTPNRYAHIICPQDPTVAFRDDRERDIAVSFAGSEGNPGGRAEHIKALNDAGIDVYSKGGKGEDNLSLQEFFDIYRRSKITLNFGRPKGITGRLFEATMCGAMLMEPSYTGHELYYRPNHDIITFDAPEDLVKKVEYFMKADVLRAQIAENGYQRSKIYTADIIWKRALGLIGIKAEE